MSKVGTFIIDEERYIVTMVDKFSDFTLVFEETCIAHWFMLGVAILDVLLILITLLFIKRESKILGITCSVWFAIITIIAIIFAHCTFCWIMIGINAALLIGTVIFFLMYKGDPTKNNNTVIKYVEVEKPVEKTTETAISENAKKDLTLKESIITAQATKVEIKLNKESLAKWLKDNYGDKVTVHRRENFTTTGLPLADTHYIEISEKQKCFIYAYEIEGGFFCIVRSDEKTAKEITAKGHKFVASAFPKTNDYAKWYTMFVDDGYKSEDEYYDTLALVIDRLTGKQVEPVKEEPLTEEVAVTETVSEVIVQEEQQPEVVVEPEAEPQVEAEVKEEPQVETPEVLEPEEESEEEVKTEIETEEEAKELEDVYKKLSEKEKAPDSFEGENGVEVVGVCFRNRKKVYKFSPNGKKLEVGAKVTVDTVNGAMVGMIVHSNYFVDPNSLEFELKNVLEVIK